MSRKFIGMSMVAVLTLAIFATTSSARVISPPGSAKGQTKNPSGLAVDFETGQLFVADTANNRVDVFGPTGTFERAFGWGVKDGENKFQVCTLSCREGIPGSGAGQFSAPTSIAVDNDATSASHHVVYVVDSANSRIEKFTPEGEFKLAFGSAGEEEGQFSTVGPVLVGVGPGGTVYVVDSVKAGSEEVEHRLQKFEPSGVAIAPQHLLLKVKNEFRARTLAVDSSGDFYVSPRDLTIRKYDPNGGFIKEIANVFDELQVGIQAIGAGVEDHVFVASSEDGAPISVMEMDAAGKPLRRFGYGSLISTASAIAASPNPASEGVYVGETEAFNHVESNGNRVLQLDFPPTRTGDLSGAL